jgi:hypothetical protein
MVQFLPPHLLGRHVGNRPERRARRRQQRVGRPREEFPGHLRQAEIEDLAMPPGGQEDVGGLDVPMDDALLVRGVQSVGDLNRVFERLSGRQRATAQSILQLLAFQQFEDDEGRRLLAHVMDDADVRVVERGCRATLAIEAIDGLLIGRDGVGQHLDGHVAIEARVASAVHLAHPSRPKCCDDLVRTKAGAGG